MKPTIDNKLKDTTPLDTINRIRQILHAHHITVIEKKWQTSLDGVYSVRINIINTTFSTNGKGTTYEYALASAYGELMERLQNLAPILLSMNFPESALEYNGFTFYYDEKKYSFEDYLNENNEWIYLQRNLSMLSETAYRAIMTLWQRLPYESSDGSFITIPFKNLSTNNLSYIPLRMLNKMYMSNGMCAGNTPDEAIIQGLCEIFERYVNKQILLKKITPPTIPDYYLERYPNISHLKETIEGNRYKIIFKDCSLGIGLPVIAVIFIDTLNDTYFVKFGSAPVFEIAAERTLTELMQGQDILSMKGLKQFSSTINIKNEHKNMIGILINGSGYYSHNLFLENHNFPYIPFKEFTGNTNTQILNKIIRYIGFLGYDIFIRENDFLDFPTYHIIIPGLSEIENIDSTKELNDYIAYNDLKRSIRSLSHLSIDHLNQLIDQLETSSYDKMVSVLDLIGLEISASTPWYYENIYLLLTALYYATGQNKRAVDTLDLFLNHEIPFETEKYYTCAKEYLNGMSDYILSTFYPTLLIKDVKDQFNHFSFRNNPINCYNCAQCIYQPHCTHFGNIKLFKQLKESQIMSYN